jgi:hypothetical protein
MNPRSAYGLTKGKSLGERPPAEPGRGNAAPLEGTPFRPDRARHLERSKPIACSRMTATSPAVNPTRYSPIHLARFFDSHTRPALNSDLGTADLLRRTVNSR